MLVCMSISKRVAIWALISFSQERHEFEILEKPPERQAERYISDCDCHIYLFSNDGKRNFSGKCNAPSFSQNLKHTRSKAAICVKNICQPFLSKYRRIAQMKDLWLIYFPECCRQPEMQWIWDDLQFFLKMLRYVLAWNWTVFIYIMICEFNTLTSKKLSSKAHHSAAAAMK